MTEADRERWDRRYRSGSHGGTEVPAWLTAVDQELPRTGRALDVATGSGRMALWLARRGLETTAVDLSGEAIRLCRSNARAEGLEFTTCVLDLESEALPNGPFLLISCFFYLQRDLFPQLRQRLGPGGCLVAELPTRRNLERHPKPGPRFLLEANELLELVAPLEVVYYREGWIDDHAVAQVAARSG